MLFHSQQGPTPTSSAFRKRARGPQLGAWTFSAVNENSLSGELGLLGGRCPGEALRPWVAGGPRRALAVRGAGSGGPRESGFLLL